MRWCFECTDEQTSKQKVRGKQLGRKKKTDMKEKRRKRGRKKGDGGRREAE